MQTTIAKAIDATPRDSFAPGCAGNGASASQRNSLALGCLNAVVDESGIPRKVLADGLGISEQTFSKWMSGAERAPLDLPDRLPDTIGDTYYARRQAERNADAVVNVLAHVSRTCNDALVIIAAATGSLRLPERAGRAAKVKP